jgi:hypothetical protein
MHRCDLLTNKNGRKGINLNTGGTLREESIKKKIVEGNNS